MCIFNQWVWQATINRRMKMGLNKEMTLEEKVEAIYGKDATEDQIAFLAENPDAYDYDDTDDNQ